MSHSNAIIGMNINKLLFKALITLLLSALIGCSKQFWYDSFKLGGETRCQYDTPTETAKENCMERLDKRSYEAYEEERNGKK